MQDCFIICPIGDEGTEIRRRSDKLLKHVLAPVLSANNYNAIRADQIPKVGLITTQVINLIIDCPLVIADLSGSNPNVFYELAIRHAVQEPYIQVINKDEKMPFDIAGVRTVEIDLGDLDSVDKAKSEIDRQIKEFSKGHKPDSPIMAAKVTKLLQSDSRLAEEIASHLNEFREIRLERDLYCPDQYEDSTTEIINVIDQIYKKVWSLRDFGSISLEDLDKKLNAILSKLTVG